MLKKDHASHNEDACLFLNETKRFPDWVIIAAFYSSIHLVDIKLFPGPYELPNGDIKNFSNLEDYHHRCKRGGGKRNIHESRLHLVQETLPEIAAEYNILHDQSFTLRYSNYKVDQSEADQAVKNLGFIKEFCLA
jgi:hypothetical protein